MSSQPLALTATQIYIELNTAAGLPGKVANWVTGEKIGAKPDWISPFTE